MTKNKLLVLLPFTLIVQTACGGAVTPVGPEPGPGPTNWTVSGRVVSNPGGQPIPGATVQPEGIAPVATDGNGTFTISGSGMSNLKTTLSAGGFLDRGIWVRGGSTRSTEDVSLISLAPPFSLDFYGEIVRGNYDRPGAPLVINRPVSSPRFYINPALGNGTEVPQSDINMVKTVISRVVPQMTGGQFQASFEDGASGGVVTVSFVAGFTACGNATLAQINFRYPGGGCNCNKDYGLSPMTVAHETGHALGFWHHSRPGVLGTGNFCVPFNPNTISYTADEQFNARIAYSRPNRNKHPDDDPSDSSFSMPDRSSLVVD